MIDTEVVQEHYVRPSRAPRLTTLESDIDTDGKDEDEDADADRRARERAHHRRSTRSVAAATDDDSFSMRHSPLISQTIN